MTSKDAKKPHQYIKSFVSLMADEGEKSRLIWPEDQQ